MVLAVLPKEFNFHLIGPENHFSHVARVLYVVIRLLLNSGFSLATLPWRTDLWSATEIVVHPTDSPITAQDFWSSFRETVGFFLTSLTKALFSWMPNLAGRPSLGRFKVVPIFFHFKIIEATVLLGTLEALEIVLYPCLDLCLATIWSQRSTDQFHGLHSLVFVLTM